MKTILITGATSGIGRHAALHLAARGHHVIASGRRQDLLDQLKSEAGSLRLDVLSLDVTDSESIGAAVSRIEEITQGRGVDILVNNAGYGQAGAVLDVDDEAVRHQFETNVFGLLAVTRAFSAAMVARGSGRVINISSVGGRVTLPLSGVYTATKHAVESLSDALRVELAPLGIQVSLIEPGAINTKFNATMIASSERVPRTGPWADVYEGANARIARLESMASGPLPVSKAITRAVESRRPRARYVAPWAYTLVVAFATRLPSWCLDAFMHRAFGLGQTRRAVAV